MSQREMGERIGVVQQWMQQIESPNVDTIPSLYQLEEIAVHLGTTPADLLMPGRFRGRVGANEDLRKRRSN
jgi:transcriptional regulator with XRE-family HTH domain